jgi:AraC-like DNA-binding protein
LNGIHLGRVPRADVDAIVGSRNLVTVVPHTAPLREWAMADPQRTVSTRLSADARLRPWVAGDYGGFDGASLPDTSGTIPATLLAPLGVYLSGPPRRPPAVVMGPSATYTPVEGPCEIPAVLVRLAPLGAYKLLGPAVSEIGGAIVGLEDIVGPDARRLSERVQSARTWEARGRLLDDFLVDRAARGPQPAPEVSHAWHLLARSDGRSTITGIARQVSWSHKHLITRFRQQIGVSPHMAARLLRLAVVWRHLDDGQSWARVAAECGYADQSHLIREFRRFTGTTPGALTTA